MPEAKNWQEIGSEIRRAVEDSINSGDFSGLGSTLSQSIGDAVETVKSSVHGDTVAVRQESYTQRRARELREQKRNAVTIQPSSGLAPFNPIGKVSGLAMKVLGGIGSFVFGLGTLALALASSLPIIGEGIVGAGIDIGIAACGIFLAGSIWALVSGNSKYKTFKTAETYLKICGKNRYCNVSDLASRRGINLKSALKEIKKLLNMGFYPQGRLDKNGTCLILDNEVYRQYLEVENQKVIEDKASAPATELDSVIAYGNDCIKELKRLNDDIPGEEISNKLSRLETLLSEIFGGLKRHPEQTKKMKKFMDYYLPTTLKLVSAYAEFDRLSVQGDDILQAKSEIEKSLDTIISAFGELLNTLFRDRVFDVTADAQVLQTMLAKEGLTNTMQDALKEKDDE